MDRPIKSLKPKARPTELPAGPVLEPISSCSVPVTLQTPSEYALRWCLEALADPDVSAGVKVTAAATILRAETAKNAVSGKKGARAAAAEEAAIGAYAPPPPPPSPYDQRFNS